MKINLLTESQIKLRIQFEGQAANWKSKSNYVFSVKVNLLTESQNQTIYPVWRSSCWLKVKIKLCIQCEGQPAD